MPSQIDRVVRSNTTSVNSDPDVLTALGVAARVCGRIHDVIIMVELGDLREGVMTNELDATIRHILRQPSLRLHGIGTNLACRSGIEPTDANMGELSHLADTVETTFGIHLDCVSGGNSANLDWDDEHGCRREGQQFASRRIDPARTRPAQQTTDRRPAHRCHHARRRSHRVEPQTGETVGRSGQNAFGETSHTANSKEDAEQGCEIWHTIVAVGRQDTDPADLQSPPGVELLDASSDHLILETNARTAPGTSIRFEPGYSALLRSMTSPYVAKRFRDDQNAQHTIAVTSNHRSTTPARRPPARTPQLKLVPQAPTTGL